MTFPKRRMGKNNDGKIEYENYRNLKAIGKSQSSGFYNGEML